MAKTTEYRKVKIAKNGVITGEHNKYGDWMKFEANRDLMLVEFAIEANSRTITQFMRLADGYGVAGFFPDGYDWSGIRDSSDGARKAMGALAERLLGAKIPTWLKTR